MKLRHTLGLCLLPLSLQAAPLPPAAVDDFIQEMVREHQFKPQELQPIFNALTVREDILQSISKPAEKTLQWHQYRPIFLTPERISEGVAFWQQHAPLLQQAERQFGVPAEIIVAIIGVETRFGKRLGQYRIAESLATLAFAYPPRAAFFRSQLKEFLLMGREEGFNPLELYGSYAGAMGQPQFIPGSYRSFAIDFDGDGRRDLWNSPADVIGSVANYLARHQWRRGETIAVPATVNAAADSVAALVKQGYKPHLPLNELASHGLQPTSPLTALPRPTHAALLALQQSSGAEYWLVFNNFYAITRYNHSELYAMAVYQLAEAIRSQLHTSPPPTQPQPLNR